ncbi:hypothetical protein Tco_1374740 [Tanacetum coccineum]
MTRSLTKELFTPNEDLERVLHSLKFDLFSDLEDQCEEEVAKAMGETTMEEYITKNQEDYESGIARPKIDEKARFELKGQFIKKLRDNTFSGSNDEDENEHIEKRYIKVLLFLGRPFFSTTNAKIDVFKKKIALRVADDKIVFKSDNPTSNIIKRVYVLGLRERMELDLEAKLMGEGLILNRSLDPIYGDYIELNDLNKPIEVRRNQVEDLGPTIKDGEIIDEHMVNIIKTRNDDEEIEGIDEYRSFCEFDRNIHIDCAYNLQFPYMIGFEHVNANFFPILSINVMSKRFYNLIMKDKIKYRGKNVVGAFMNVPDFVGKFSIVTDFAVVENMDVYRDQDMGVVIVGKPFCREISVKPRRFDGMTTIYNGNDSVTYQMA